MDSKKKNSVPRKRLRKYHTRKAPIISSYMDMAEARREIVHALHLHRCSASSSSSSSSFNCPKKYTLLGQRVTSQQYCCYSIVESMPIPEPTWSTTAPAILTTPSLLPPPPPPPPFSVTEVPEFDWWLEFLKSLDGKKSESNNNGEVILQKYLPHVEENIVMGNAKGVVLGQLEDGLIKNESPNLIDENDDDPNYQFINECMVDYP